MTGSEAEKLCRQVIETAKDAGEYLRSELQQFNSSFIELKGFNDFVSKVDRNAEEKIIASLSKILPDAAFLAEENTVKLDINKPLRWVIDPLDGTTNFIQKIPAFSVSIALQNGDETVLGVVYEVNQDECFFAWKEGESYLNGQKIQVSQKTEIAQAMIGTGFPYSDFGRMKNYLSVLDHFLQNTRGVRRIGSAALDLAYVANGRFDAFFEYGLKPWDIAAGAFIVQQAGGVVKNFEGGDDFGSGEEVFACAPGIYDEVLKVIKDNFHNGNI